MTEIKKNLDRRTIVKGAAWSAPVLAAAIATPLAAASDTDTVKAGRITVTGGCIPILGALVGGHTITNNNNYPVEVTIVQRLTLDSTTGILPADLMDGGLFPPTTGWASFWVADGAPSFPASTCTNSGSWGTCYARETTRTWTRTIPANSSYTVSKVLPLSLLNNHTSYLTVAVGAVPVNGSVSRYNPEVLGGICA